MATTEEPKANILVAHEDPQTLEELCAMLRDEVFSEEFRIEGATTVEDARMKMGELFSRLVMVLSTESMASGVFGVTPEGPVKIGMIPHDGQTKDTRQEERAFEQAGAAHTVEIPPASAIGLGSFLSVALEKAADAMPEPFDADAELAKLRAAQAGA